MFAHMVTTTDVVVIGSGIIGCSAALELARNGHRVVVVDRQTGPGRGSTGASSTVVRFHYSTWEGVATAWESRFGWEAWREHVQARRGSSTARLIKTGGLVLDGPAFDTPAVLSLFGRVGVPYEVWDAAEINRQVPALDTGRFWPPKRVTSDEFWGEPSGTVTGFFTPDSGFVDDPQLAAQDLRAAAEQGGVQFVGGVSVVAIEQRADRVCGVTLSTGDEISAPIVLNAAGPHSGHINALAHVLNDFAVRTRPLRQEVHVLQAPLNYSLANGLSPVVNDVDLGTYFRPHPGGSIVVGGLEPECDPLNWVENADSFDPNPTQAVWDAQVLRLARRMPELKVPNRPRGIAHIYDVSDDWIPIYDRTALGGFYVAIGTSGNQFKNAPVVGHLMNALIGACEAGQDHDRDPVLVTLPRTRHPVDMSHYSRLRHGNRLSSRSVMG